jgi:hypothetical protein
MNGKHRDGIVDKMGTLVSNQSERVIKLGQNEFINGLNYDCNHVSPWHLCLHPWLCCIIGSNQNVLITMWATRGLNGANEYQTPFHKWFNWEHGDQLCH